MEASNTHDRPKHSDGTDLPSVTRPIGSENNTEVVDVEASHSSIATLYPETDLSQGIVGWDSQNDSQNPQNFTARKKWEALAVVSGMTFISTTCSSIPAPGINFIAEEFNVTNQTILSLVVSIYLLGYTFGPLVLGPLSEIKGRRLVLSAANWYFVVWQIGCALSPNVIALIIFRLMAGIGGSGVMTLGAGVIADLFPPEKRGLATALWSLGSLLGPLIGPVCGGFISESIGWRWVFWILTMVSGTVAAGIEIVNRETYAPVLLQRKTERLAKELGRDDLHSALVKKEELGLRPSFRRNLRVGLRRPFLLYFKSPIVFLLSTYVAFQYGLLYLFFTSMPAVFRGIYSFSVGMSGVAYIGIGVGFGLGMLLSALTNDRMMISMARRNGGKMEPEMRLPLMILSAAASPISFFWYGWAVQTEAHWIVPIIGTVPFAFGLNGIYLTSQNYVIDSYLEYAASANATLVVTRSILGTVLPLAGPKLFESLDYGWGNTLLGFISLAFVPVPIIFTKYGKYLREKYVVNL